MNYVSYFSILGAGLGNSPIGLAAYILEKFSTWTNIDYVNEPDGGLLNKDYPISLDRLLDNVSLYWLVYDEILTLSRYFKFCKIY